MLKMLMERHYIHDLDAFLTRLKCRKQIKILSAIDLKYCVKLQKKIQIKIETIQQKKQQL